MPGCIQVSKDVQLAAQLTVQTWIDCAARLLHMRTTAKLSDHVPQLVDVLQSVYLSCSITPCIYDCNGIMDKKCILRLLLMSCMAVSNISTFLA